MLIPVPVLGAIIGGTLGGVAIGFYQKIVVNKAKSSMLKMLDEIQARIMDDGLVLYDDKVVKILKINPEHFHQNKPKGIY